MQQPDWQDPWTGNDIAIALTRTCEESIRYWQSFTPEMFLAPLGTAWSPADNVRHLTKAMRALTSGLKVPRFLLGLRFGTAQTPSRSYESICRTYLQRLSTGGTAGRFTPSPLQPLASAAATQADILDKHTASLAELKAAAARWPEPSLDRYQLPHPLLGMLTVREMLFFTIYHNQHHVAVVHRRASAMAMQNEPR